MVNYFKIKKVSIRGSCVKPVMLEFGSKLTIITGGSDSGKTYLFNLIKYLLGEESLENAGISEAVGYDKGYIEFSLGGKDYTIERELQNNNNYYLFNDGINTVGPDKLINKITKTPSSKNSFNSIFYEKLSFKKAKVRVNVSGGISKFNLGSVFDSFCVDEITILTSNSPFLSAQYADHTRNKSEFKFLLTQRDDAKIGAEKPNKKAKVFLKKQVKDLIEEISKGLIYPEMSLLAINEKIDDIDILIESQMKTSEGLLDIVSKKTNLINDIENDINDLKKKEHYVSMMIDRFTMLKLCYISDLERVNTISQANFFLENFSEELCNNCQHPIKNSFELSYENYHLSCLAESNKINSQLNGLIRSIEANKKDIESINASISDSEYIRNNEVEDYYRLRNTDLKISQKEIERLYEYKETFLSDLSKHKIINSLESKEESIDKDVYDSSDFDKLSKNEIIGLVDEVRCLLNSIEFNSSKENAIYFDDKKYDFVINGKDRALYGKGSRAVIYACIVISLSEFLAKNRKPQIGFVLLDSPLVTHYDKKRDIKENEINPVSLTNKFYSHLIKDDFNIQVILIENKGPSFVVHNNDEIKWIDLNADGSTGLFPKASLA
jgi:hypothetical protein